jgi:hypothetical protein
MKGAEIVPPGAAESLVVRLISTLPSLLMVMFRFALCLTNYFAYWRAVSSVSYSHIEPIQQVRHRYA